MGSQYFSSTVSRTVENPDTATLSSPPGTKTPPPDISKRSHANGNNINGHERAASDAIDPDALSRALKDFEDAGRTRERTPGGSPSRKRQRVYGDRSVTSISSPVLETELVAKKKQSHEAGLIEAVGAMESFHITRANTVSGS